MGWYIAVPIIYLIAIIISEIYCAKDSDISIGIYQSFLLGLLVGPFAALAAGFGLYMLLTPELYEFDFLVFSLFLVPIGVLLGALSGAVVGLHMVNAGKCVRLLSFFGAIPLLAICFWSLIDVFRSGFYTSGEGTMLFWQLVFIFPLLWILVLWYWSEKQFSR